MKNPTLVENQKLVEDTSAEPPETSREPNTSAEPPETSREPKTSREPPETSAEPP